MPSSAPGTRQPDKTAASSLFQKLWRSHVIEQLDAGVDLLRVDRHLLHDASGPWSLKALSDRRLPVDSRSLTFATADHTVSTEPGRTDAVSDVNQLMLQGLRRYCEAFGIRLFDLNDDEQGIVHVIGPELGLTLPGASIVCGDSHTCTHGAFGALAWGIGNTEVLQVLATQALIVERPKSMRTIFRGFLKPGVSAKDLILALIGRYGAKAGAGYAVEFSGAAVDVLSMEARMALCNLAVEFGARFGLIAPDEETIRYVEGRRFAPKGELWLKAVEYWRSLKSDPDAAFDAQLELDAAAIGPQVTWGTSPEQVISIDQKIPSPEEATDAKVAEGRQRALEYMGLKAGVPIEGTPIQHVFIGSCANARLSDIAAAASLVRGRKVADGVRAWVVPGSRAVKRAAEASGFDRILIEAGFEWREPGCSMCVAMNGDHVPPSERAVSTSNRNFVGRQGPGARTHLASPLTAAASAISGRIADARGFAG